MSDFERMKGTWIHALPWDSDDYLAEYSISGTEQSPKVEAFDSADGEAFIIENVKWVNNRLVFTSIMPSTKREGINEFSLSEDGELRSKFMFTVYETLHRKNT